MVTDHRIDNVVIEDVNKGCELLLLITARLLQTSFLKIGSSHKLKLFLLHGDYTLRLAVFIKSEMLREVRENSFCKYQRYPIITIESQNKTIMTDKRHNDVIINYNLALNVRLNCCSDLLFPLFCAKRGSTTMGSSLFVTLVGD